MTAALRLVQPEEVTLDQRIAAELDNAFAAEKRGDKIAAHGHLIRMAELHGMRSPETVERMEKQMGLR